MMHRIRNYAFSEIEYFKLNLIWRYDTNELVQNEYQYYIRLMCDIL